MKLLIYTDLQATEGNARCNHNPALPLQRYRVAKLFDQLVEIYNEHGCDGLVDLGDTTDDRAFIYRATLDVITEGLGRFIPNPKGIKLTGNHEQLLKETDVNSAALFSPYFGHVDTPVVKLTDDVVAICQPFHEDYSGINARLASELDKYRGKKKTILLAHGDVFGVKYDSGEPCKKGMSQELIDAFDLALLGHVHRGQQIGPNAHYIGSPFQQDFGEANQRKRVAILTVSGSDIDLEWIEIKGMPQHYVVGLAEFLGQADPAEEHRYNVVLTSVEEAETFYASPLAPLGKPKLAYVAADKEEVVEELKTETDQELLDRYAKTRSISGVPDDVAGDLVEIGMMLLKQANAP